MKENRPLFIFLGILLMVVCAILVPDYIACHEIHFRKSLDEQRIELLEAWDMRHFVRSPVRSMTIDFNALTVTVDSNGPAFDAVQFRNLLETWRQSYTSRHEGHASISSCLRVSVTTLDGRTLAYCESHDSVMRLVEDACDF
jgi:hypothetical protein